MSRSTSVVILAAGQGTRMKSALPKVLHELCGRTLLDWVLDQALALDPKRIVVVVGHGADQVRASVERGPAASRVSFVVQAEQNGTGHALQVAAPELGTDPGTVVVLYGDMPVLRPTSLGVLLETAQEHGDEATAIFTAISDDPRGFGRILRDEEGEFVAVREEKDCSPEERAIPEVNTGVYAFPGKLLLECLPQLSAENAQGEYYLTDVPVMLAAAGKPVETVLLEDLDETIGVNDLGHLAEARWALQLRILEEHLANGVAIEDPSTTYIDHNVTIGAGTRILPCTVIRSGVTIGEGCEVGPFTHLRVGTVLEEGAEIGNFTECKKSLVGAHAKAKHLSYLGDAHIGAHTNIGAGTIFANYDGTAKHVTEVGEQAFIGSGTIIVAPNTIGRGATTGAGAVITRSATVGDGETWVGMPARKHSATATPTATAPAAGDERGA